MGAGENERNPAPAKKGGNKGKSLVRARSVLPPLAIISPARDYLVASVTKGDVSKFVRVLMVVGMTGCPSNRPSNRNRL